MAQPQKMTRGDVRLASQHINTETALDSIARAFPMTAVSELRIRRLSDGTGFEFEMMQGPPTQLIRFQLDRIPNDVGYVVLQALKDAVTMQKFKTTEKLDSMGVIG